MRNKYLQCNVQIQGPLSWDMAMHLGKNFFKQNPTLQHSGMENAQRYQ